MICFSAVVLLFLLANFLCQPIPHSDGRLYLVGDSGVYIRIRQAYDSFRRVLSNGLSGVTPYKNVKGEGDKTI